MSPWPNRFLGLRRRQLFNIYLLLGSIGIVLAISLFTIQIAQSVERQSRLTTYLFSGMVSRYFLGGAKGDIQQVVRTINEIEVPFIVTDNSGRPILWNEPVIGIPVRSYQELLQVDPSKPADAQMARIFELIRRFDRNQEPFAILAPESGQRVGTLHYGPSKLSQRIRWMPYLELLLLAVFFLLILWALQLKKEGEQQRLFAGMAKETAHQLGTPITSIMGWLEILREKVAGDEVMTELDRDVERLGKVSARFSQIGSRPQLDETDLAGVIQGAIQYFQRRLPHLGGRVDLRSEGAARNRCRFNRELMEWVLENLIKNGIDSLKDGKGTISIQMADGANSDVIVRVSDTGCGIPAGMRNKIFEPGFTTKARGWGMGLALVKRIVTQYHGGRIQVAASGPRGTTFAITLPAEEG